MLGAQTNSETPARPRSAAVAVVAQRRARKRRCTTCRRRRASPPTQHRLRAWRRRRLYERHVERRLDIRQRAVDGKKLVEEQETRAAAGLDPLFGLPLPWQSTTIRAGAKRDILSWVAFAVELRGASALHIAYEDLAALAGCSYHRARNACGELRAAGWLCSDEQYDEDTNSDEQPIGWSVPNTWRPGPELEALLGRERERKAARDRGGARVAMVAGAAAAVVELAVGAGACPEDHRKRGSDSVLAVSIGSVSSAVENLSGGSLEASLRARDAGGGGVAGNGQAVGAAGAGTPQAGGDEDPAGAARLPAPTVATPAPSPSPEPATVGAEAGEGVVAAPAPPTKIARLVQQAAARAAARDVQGVTAPRHAAPSVAQRKREAIAFVDQAAAGAARLGPLERVTALAALAASLLVGSRDEIAQAAVDRAIEHHAAAVEELPPSERVAARKALLVRIGIGSTGASS